MQSKNEVFHSHYQSYLIQPLFTLIQPPSSPISFNKIYPSISLKIPNFPQNHKNPINKISVISAQDNLRFHLPKSQKVNQQNQRNPEKDNLRYNLR